MKGEKEKTCRLIGHANKAGSQYLKLGKINKCKNATLYIEMDRSNYSKFMSGIHHKEKLELAHYK